MAFISKKNTTQASQSQNEFCKAVADLFQHSRDSREKIDRSVQYNRTVPCRFGEKCKKIDPNTGVDTCSYANSLDKLRGKACRQDGSCDQHKKGLCKWYHEKQGQTMSEYAAINGWFQHSTSVDANGQDQNVWQQGVLAEVDRMKQGIPSSNYADECNRRVSKLYEEQFADEIDREMEEVCNEIDKEAHEYEFEQEVCRLYQDPDEVELDEKIAMSEMHQLTCDMRQYMYNVYGLVC
jgi:hypothetical protein